MHFENILSKEVDFDPFVQPKKEVKLFYYTIIQHKCTK